MFSFILGEKGEQKQIFNEQGKRVPATVVKTDSCYLIDIKEPPKNGYFSVLLGFGQTKKIKKSIFGQIKKAGVQTPLRFLKEIRIKTNPQSFLIEKEGKKGIKINNNDFFIGDKIDPLKMFKQGEKVSVIGYAKGKGFQGVVKRHHFKGGPRTHGQSDRERAPGSIGQTTTPGRVYKGKRMAGRMGGQRVKIKNLEILEIKENQLLIKGLVPGHRKGLLEIIGEAKN